jgi:hypothetical protein
MKAKLFKGLKTSILLVIVILATRLIPLFPWWSFIVPVIIVGMVLAGKNWNFRYFLTGFLTGFFLWAIVELYYHFTYNGEILTNKGHIPLFVSLVISGIIGGSCTGLALYTGKALKFRTDNQFVLEDEKESIVNA